MALSASTSPISDSDYRRIFQVIYSVLESEKANTANACVFFAIAGAAILNQHYKIRALPLAGAALYVVDGSTQTILAFASRDPSEELSSMSGFHCWIQCNGFAIDFMAPMFPESMPDSTQVAVPRRIFKKPLSSMSQSHEELIRAGDFILSPNPDLTQSILNNFVQKPAQSDLVNICLQWYKRPPFKIATSIKIGDQHGKLKTVPLLQLPISGSW
jgi:hypothetical protein